MTISKVSAECFVSLPAKSGKKANSIENETKDGSIGALRFVG